MVLYQTVLSISVHAIVSKSVYIHGSIPDSTSNYFQYDTF